MPANLRSNINPARRIAIGSDDAGFEIKHEIIPLLESLGHQVLDVGAHTAVPGDDYPDFAEALAVAVKNHQVDRGVLCVRSR